MAKIWLKIWLKVKENGAKKIKLAKMVAKEKKILVRTLFDTLRVQEHSFVENEHEIFPMVILFLPDSRRAVVSFWQKNVHKYWLTALRTKPVHESKVR